jgi:hypothetical protein
MSVPEKQGDTVVATLSRSIASALGAPPQGAKSLPDAEPDEAAEDEDQAPASRGRRLEAALPVVQLLMPMMAWNWPVPPTGSIPYQQLMLADSVPASTDSGVPYEPTGASFSRSYATFLQLLAPERFPLPTMLSAAIAATVPPAGSPSNASAPDGWVCAPDGAGINRWRLAYGVSMTPAEWIAEVAGNPDNAVELSLPVSEEKALTLTDQAGQRQSLALQGEVEHAVITATALGQVSVTPGSWFDDSLLRLGRNGAFVSTLASATNYAGLLSCRVSGLIVAYNPVLRIVGPDPSASPTGAALSTAAAVEIGGFKFSAPVQAPAGASGDGAGAASAAYSARATGAWIIGVTLEVFP